MNTEIIINLQKQVEELSLSFKVIEKTVNALKINDQRQLLANNQIPPGISCKIAYDKNGLVIGGMKLENTDIPQLDIDKINNLKMYLENKASNKDFEKFKSTISEIIKPTVNELGKIVGTGTKVNYNSDGRIISSTDLLPSDIPQLPISKINGLSDIISEMSIRSISKDSEDDNIPNIKVNPGTYAKVTIDKYGRVITGSNIDINDIPREIINRLNNIESKFIDIPSNQVILNMRNEMINKVESNKPIIPGTYTKVKVDSKGLITYGEKITIKDLPDLNISDIIGLEKTIRDKIDRKDFFVLNDTVNSLVNSLSKVGEIPGIKDELKKKVSEETVDRLSSKVNNIQRTLDSIIDRIPSDMLLDQLNQIQNELSSISGRVNSIENNLKNINIIK